MHYLEIPSSTVKDESALINIAQIEIKENDMSCEIFRLCCQVSDIVHFKAVQNNSMAVTCSIK